MIIWFTGIAIYICYHYLLFNLCSHPSCFLGEEEVKKETEHINFEECEEAKEKILAFFTSYICNAYTLQNIIGKSSLKVLDYFNKIKVFIVFRA